MVCCLSILGVAAAAFLIYKIATALYLIFYPHVIAKILGHTLYLKSLGKWAVITGATDGIGKGYAKALAKRGINVFLISRSEEKLKNTADEIRHQSPNVEIKTLQLDFGRATPEDYRTRVASALNDIEVGLLINNVGMHYTYPAPLHEVEGGEEFLQNIVLVNAASAVQMSHLVLPQMLKRNKGAIVMISSCAAFAPMPIVPDNNYIGCKCTLYFSKMVCCLSILGVAAAAFLLYTLATALYLIFYPHVIAKILGHTLDLKSLGKWAVITGATDGIGKGYAKALAKRGINVLLMSRSEEKLKNTADEIRQQSPNVEIKILQLDFARATPEDYRTRVASALKDIEVGLLINNVGMSYSCIAPSHEVEGGEEFLQNIVLVNAASAVQMSRLVLPQMLKRNKGGIVMISSASALAPMPWLSVYSSTKIFLDYLSQGLSFEFADTGLTFQTVNPIYVVTKMTGLKRTSFWVPDPGSYANNALDTIGLVSQTSGCFSHDIQRIGMKTLISIMPSSMLGKQCLAALKKISANYSRSQEKKSKKQ